MMGCDEITLAPEGESSPSIGESEPSEPLPPGVRMRMHYDQTEVTYSNVWPGSIVGNNEKAKEEGAMLMTEYEKTREVYSYDEEGYLTASYEYLEGHPDMNMPEASYSELRDQMPYNPEDENPIVRSELKGNAITYFREDGSVERERPIEPESFRVDPARLDSLEEARDDDLSPDRRRENVRRSLEERGLSLQQLDENRVAFEQTLEEVQAVSRVQKVVDLRIGKPIHLRYELKNGNTDLIETRRYKYTSGIPVMVQSVTYDFDDRSGSWGVVARTEVTRQNISVQFD